MTANRILFAWAEYGPAGIFMNPLSQPQLVYLRGLYCGCRPVLKYLPDPRLTRSLRSIDEKGKQSLPKGIQSLGRNSLS
jgi:hypothetical protein